MSRLCSSLTCVVLPLLSRPSSTTNAPRPLPVAGSGCSAPSAPAVEEEEAVASPTVLMTGALVGDGPSDDEAAAAGSPAAGAAPFVLAMVGCR